MKFQPGKSGNPQGRVKGIVGGRMRALTTLDKVLARGANQELLAAALEEELRSNAVGFFKSIVMPLLPREARLDVRSDGVIKWKSLLGDEPGEKPRFDEQGLPLPEADRE